MSEATIELVLAEGHGSIFVRREKLISESSVFCRLIDELGFNQIPIQDFDPNNVVLFIDLLEVDNRGNLQIRNDIFRELHKIGVVFDTKWLVNSCLEWLREGIRSTIITTDYDEKLFQFQECYFILSKWKQRISMDLFIQNVVKMQDHFFISRYLMDVDSRETAQLNLMLLMCGSNSQVIIEIIIRNTARKTSLSRNIKHLLQKMNLAVCYEQNAVLYQEMFDMLSNLPELDYDDQRFLFETFRKSIKDVTYRRTLEKVETVVYSREEWKELIDVCKCDKDIMECVKNGRLNCVFKIVILVILAAKLDDFFTMETRKFVSQLTDTADSKFLKKASFEFLDLVLALLEKSDRPEKENVVEILKLFKCQPELSSHVENVHLYSDPSKFNKLTRLDYASKCPFEFKHPGLPNDQECKLPGKCGFIIKGEGIGSAHNRHLTKSSQDYIGMDIHYHDLVCAEDMFYYKTWYLGLEDGSRVEVPFRWRWATSISGSIWDWWLPPITEINMGKYCVVVNVQRFLVGKDVDSIFSFSE